MGLFSGLEAFGFKNEDLKVYSDTKEEEKAEQQAQKQDVRVNEEDCLFPKHINVRCAIKNSKA